MKRQALTERRQRAARWLRALAPWLLALLAGLAQAMAMATPWSGQPLWWLQIVSMALLAALLARQPSWRRAGLVGWLFATAWLAGTWWWLYISLHVYGGLAAPLTIAAVLALAAFLGSYYAAAAAVYRALAGRAAGAGALVFAAGWLLAELLRGVLFTGFPWGAGGYAHVDGPLAALAPWVGVYGIGFVATWIAALPAQALGAGRRTALAHNGMRATLVSTAAAASLLATAHLLALPGGGSRPAGTLSVALLQGNIAQDEKFQGASGVPDALDWYARAIEASTAALVVAPETAIPLLPAQLPEGYLAALGDALRRSSRAALVGMPLGSYEAGYTNSVIGLHPQGAAYRYDKHHLVPFGEFIPPLFRWFIDLMNIPLGDFNRGAVGQPSFVWAGQRLAPNVCYEDLFGEELGARFIDPLTAPTMFVNVSNIAWFGDSVAIDQHLSISRMRTLELQRPMLRATNTGATAVIDHTGRVLAQLPRLQRGVLVAEVQGRDGLTPFAWWVARAGLAPYWTLALAVLALAALRVRLARNGRRGGDL